MWPSVVTVVIVSSLISSVVSLADLEYNVIPEDSLQDLTVRTKKSPAEDDERRTSSKSDSKSGTELKAVLTKDIKRKIEDLKELKSAYEKVEADFFGSDKPSTDKRGSEILDLETKTSLKDSLSETDSESVRIARQYFPSFSYANNQYQNQNHYGQNGLLPQNHYSNGKYPYFSSHPKYSSIDRDSPYIAQYNPSSRTFAIKGIKGAFHAEIDKIPMKQPELSVHIPAVPVPAVPVPAVPVHTVPVHTVPVHKPVEHKPQGHPVLPEALPASLIQPVTVPSHKPIKVPEHKPHEISYKPIKHETKLKPELFFSKNIILGPSTGFGEGHSYYPYIPYYSYPHREDYFQPGYSSYLQELPFVDFPTYWFAADKDGYSNPGLNSFPATLPNYNNYGPASFPANSYEPSPAYHPSSEISRRDSHNFQRYQDEMDSLLSQFFRAAPAGDETNSPSVEQLREDIEKEQKRIQTLQEELKTPQSSGVSQSFVDWLTGEIDEVYSKWTHLKDDITKTKQDPVVSVKDNSKVENIKA